MRKALSDRGGASSTAGEQPKLAGFDRRRKSLGEPRGYPPVVPKHCSRSAIRSRSVST